VVKPDQIRPNQSKSKLQSGPRSATRADDLWNTPSSFILHPSSFILSKAWRFARFFGRRLTQTPYRRLSAKLAFRGGPAPVGRLYQRAIRFEREAPIFALN
jgi:hypothetical protein